MQSEKLQNFIIKADQSIRRAMEAIENNWHEIVFVEDENHKIVGTVTDGDIRRGLLAGRTFETTVEEIMSKKFVKVSKEVDRATVLDMMKAYSIRQIPIINDDNKLIAIHFLEELIGTSAKPNIAIIMAGGKGVRIRPLSENCPKPMIRVAGRPILERVILHLIGYGIRNIYISVNYLGEMIENYFGDGKSYGCSINYLREEKELGTGGSLSLLPETPKDPFIVLNGDLVTQVDIGNMIDFHINEGTEATIGVNIYKANIPFGVITKKGNRLLELLEKPSENYLINAGIYVFNPSVLAYIPRNEELPITSLFDILLEKNISVGVHAIKEDWIDVGNHEDFRRANGVFYPSHDM